MGDREKGRKSTLRQRQERGWKKGGDRERGRGGDRVGEIEREEESE